MSEENEFNVDDVSNGSNVSEHAEEPNNDATIVAESIDEFNFSKKTKTAKLVTAALAITVGAGLIVGSQINNDFVYKPTAQVEVFDVSSNKDSITYEVVVKNMDVETITLKVYNTFTQRTSQIIMGENKGTFTDLASDMTYTVSLVEKDVLIMKKTIVTNSEE